MLNCHSITRMPKAQKCKNLLLSYCLKMFYIIIFYSLVNFRLQVWGSYWIIRSGPALPHGKRSVHPRRQVVEKLKEFFFSSLFYMRGAIIGSRSILKLASSRHCLWHRRLSKIELKNDIREKLENVHFGDNMQSLSQ